MSRRVLRHRDDVRSVAFVVLLLLAMAAQWLGLARHPLLYALTLVFAFIACVVNHNHQHCPTFVRPWLNRIFAAMLSLAIGQPASAIVPMHNLNHHRHNNGAEDFVRTSLVGFRWNLLNLLFFPFVAVASYARAKSREIKSWRSSSPRLYRQLVVERLTLYPTLLLLILVRPDATMLYVLSPCLFGQWAIIAINLVQHDGCDSGSEYNHARNFTGRWLNWWVLNNGFHTAHHLRPGLHWSLLPDFHARLRHHIDARLECRSLFVTLITLYVWPGRRPAMERRPS